MAENTGLIIGVSVSLGLVLLGIFAYKGKSGRALQVQQEYNSSNPEYGGTRRNHSKQNKSRKK